VLDPGGAGLEATSWRLQGAAHASFTLDVPWRDADLARIDRPWRFGSPLSRPAGPIGLDEDTARGRMRVAPLAVAAGGPASLAAIAPVAAAAPRVHRRGGAWSIENPLGVPLQRVVLAAGAASGTISDLPPGATRAISLSPGDGGVTGWQESWWWAALGSQPLAARVPAGAYLLVAETAEPAPRDVTLSPAAAVRARALRIVVGPAPPDGVEGSGSDAGGGASVPARRAGTGKSAPDEGGG
jgi:hypothetical protein